MEVVQEAKPQSKFTGGIKQEKELSVIDVCKVMKVKNKELGNRNMW